MWHYETKAMTVGAASAYRRHYLEPEVGRLCLATLSCFSITHYELSCTKRLNEEAASVDCGPGSGAAQCRAERSTELVDTFLVAFGYPRWGAVQCRWVDREGRPPPREALVQPGVERLRLGADR